MDVTDRIDTVLDEGAFARMYDEIEDYIHRHKKKQSKKQLSDYVWKTFKSKDKNMTPAQFSETFEEIWARV